MEGLGNLKIQDEGRPPRWILAFAVYGLPYRNSNAEEKHIIKFEDSSCSSMRIIGNLKIQDGAGCHVAFLYLQYITHIFVNEQWIKYKKFDDSSCNGMYVMSTLKIEIVASRHVGFWHLQYTAETIGYRILIKRIKSGNSRSNSK